MKQIIIKNLGQLQKAMDAAVEQNRRAAESLCISIKESNGTIKRALTK